MKPRLGTELLQLGVGGVVSSCSKCGSPGLKNPLFLFQPPGRLLRETWSCSGAYSGPETCNMRKEEKYKKENKMQKEEKYKNWWDLSHTH